jgi:hypothetical protein
LIANIILPWQAVASREGCSSRTINFHSRPMGQA